MLPRVTATRWGERTCNRMLDRFGVRITRVVQARCHEEGRNV